MKYTIEKDKVVVCSNDDFNIQQILDCGQIFRYKKSDFGYIIYAREQKIEVFCHKNTIKIFCKNLDFIVNYFDLNTNYANIKADLRKSSLMGRALDAGGGIRILKQDPLEMLISFIISANNNIPRIKNTIEKICLGYGTNMGDYFAFPTLEQLKTIPKTFFRECGCGYRDAYLVDTISQLASGFNLEELYSLNTKEARAQLMKLKGVGRKVADCILLFGYHKTDVFPTDTWISKVYFDIFEKELSAEKVSDYFLDLFKDYSGYAQQYLFYERMNRKN